MLKKITILRFLILFFWSQMLLANTDVTTALRNQINILEQQQTLPIENEKITAATGLLANIYKIRQYAAVWTHPEQVKTLVSNIETIDQDGLSSNDYHLQGITKLRQKIAENQGNANENQANLDILLSNALLRLVYHLTYGKIDPYSLDPNWNFSRKFIDGDPVSLFNKVLASNSTLADYIFQLRNQGTYHKFLKVSLKQYRALKINGGWPVIPEGGTLKPGAQDSRIPLIHQRLMITGDIQSPAPDESIYTAELVAGIKKFQDRHVLESDGIIGKKTLAAMNITVSARIDQIRANLERSRWVSQDIHGKFVIVNIAGFQAYLVEDKKNYLALQSSGW